MIPLDVLLKYTGADVFECPALRERNGRTTSSHRRRRKRCDANIAELIPHKYDVLRVDVGAPRQMTRVEARYELLIHANFHMVTAEIRFVLTPRAGRYLQFYDRWVYIHFCCIG